MIHIFQQLSLMFLLTIGSGIIFYFLGQNKTPSDLSIYYLYTLGTLFSLKILSFYSVKLIKSFFLFFTIGGFAKLSFKTISQLIAITYFGFWGFPIAYLLANLLFNIIFLKDFDLLDNYLLDRNSILEIFNISFFVETVFIGVLVPYLLFSEFNPLLSFRIDLVNFNIFKLELTQFTIIFTILMFSQFTTYTVFRRLAFRFGAGKE